MGGREEGRKHRDKRDTLTVASCTCSHGDWGACNGGTCPSPRIESLTFLRADALTTEQNRPALDSRFCWLAGSCTMLPKGNIIGI